MTWLLKARHFLSRPFSGLSSPIRKFVVYRCRHGSLPFMHAIPLAFIFVLYYFSWFFFFFFFFFLLILFFFFRLNWFHEKRVQWAASSCFFVYFNNTGQSSRNINTNTFLRFDISSSLLKMEKRVEEFIIEKRRRILIIIRVSGWMLCGFTTLGDVKNRKIAFLFFKTIYSHFLEHFEDMWYRLGCHIVHWKCISRMVLFYPHLGSGWLIWGSYDLYYCTLYLKKDQNQKIGQIQEVKVTLYICFNICNL